MNRLSEQHPGNDTLVPVDPERHALEMRIEHAKSRIAEDLERAVAVVRRVASGVGRGLGTLVVVTGLVLAGVVAAALTWRRQRRVRMRWR